jgi:hypothetical protein
MIDLFKLLGGWLVGLFRPHASREAETIRRLATNGGKPISPWRWTNGDALPPLPADAAIVEVELVGGIAYGLDGVPAAASRTGPAAMQAP